MDSPDPTVEIGKKRCLLKEEIFVRSFAFPDQTGGSCVETFIAVDGANAGIVAEACQVRQRRRNDHSDALGLLVISELLGAWRGVNCDRHVRYHPHFSGFLARATGKINPMSNVTLPSANGSQRLYDVLRILESGGERTSKNSRDEADTYTSVGPVAIALPCAGIHHN